MTAANVRFSNRPVWVKRFQTIHCCSVDVARGLVLLSGNRLLGPSIMGFENGVDQSIGRPCRRTDGRSSGHCDLTSSIVPRGTSCHRMVELAFLLSSLVIYSSHAATAFLLQRNSVPSTQMRCMMTAKRRASATIAFFMPRRLAICIAQALSQDHFAERTSMIWAAS